MALRVKRAVQIMISNYECITGACAITSDRRIGYSTENMQLTGNELDQIVMAYDAQISSMVIKHVPFMVALHDKHGVVAINPDGATSFIVGTGKGVWYVCVFAPMDQDKFGIMNECVQAAKNLETSVSLSDI